MQRPSDTLLSFPSIPRAFVRCGSLIYSNLDFGCLLRPITTLFRQRQIRCYPLPHRAHVALSRSRMRPRGMLVRFPDVLAST